MDDIYVVYGTYLDDDVPMSDILRVTNNGNEAQRMCSEAQNSAFMYSGVYISRETLE